MSVYSTGQNYVQFVYLTFVAATLLHVASPGTVVDAWLMSAMGGKLTLAAMVLLSVRIVRMVGSGALAHRCCACAPKIADPALIEYRAIADTEG